MTWEDITGDPDAGKSNEHETKEAARKLTRGVGRSNVQMVVLSPRGRLLHVITGYVSPEELFFELTEALASWKEIKEAALTAELDAQQRELVVRQDAVQKAWREHFGPKGRAAKAGAAPGGRATWQERQAQHDREVVRANPLVHAGTITTRMLTGGPGAHFGYSSGGDEDRSKPIINELRRRLGAPPVRETEADKRLRKRREDAATPARGSAPSAGPGRAPAPTGRAGSAR